MVMHKKVTEELVKEKAKILLENRCWRRFCLVILLLLPKGKLASRCFIYEKIKEWGFWNQFGNKEIDYQTNVLDILAHALYGLHADGFLHKEDLSRMSKEKLDKFCQNKVLGVGNRGFFVRWIQSAFYLSTKGRNLARETIFPLEKRKFHYAFFKSKKGGDQNLISHI